MYYKSNIENDVEEINKLVNLLDISASDAIEIINIYFECYADSWTYMDYLMREIRIIRDINDNQLLIAKFATNDNASLFRGDDYVMLTNYQTLINMEEIGDCLPTPSF